MLKNYLKIAFRNIIRQKLFSFINVFGLAAGMTCSILILLWIQDEISYDKFHKNGDDIYRVVENQFYAGGEIFPVAVTPGPLARALKDEYPEIVNSCRVTFASRSLKYGDNLFSESLALVDSSFLEMFTFPLIHGDASSALIQPFSILLSENAAEKYFGKENPIGKTIIANDKASLEVTGVFKNVPENSHLKFDFLIPFKILIELGRNLDEWGNNSFYTYVQLNRGTDAKLVDEKIKDIIKRNNEGSVTEIYLQSLFDIHLYSGSKYTADIGGHGNIEYVNIFALVALFVLLIACINFMNLSTARSAKRAKEVGLRKVVGAVRFQIARQFFVESILLTFVALVVALLLVNLLLPAFNDLSGKTIDFFEMDSTIVGGLFLLALLTGIISGSYPALYLSSFLPVKVLKESNSSDKKGSLFRKILVVSQFTLSIILIISTIVVYNQLNFIQNKNLGFKKENIAYIPIGEKIQQKLEQSKSELLQNSNILAVSSSSNVPTYYGNSSSGFDWEGKNPDDVILMHNVSVDEDYINTFNMQMARGRFFSKDFVSDTGAIVVNETAIKVMGMKDPIGKRLTMWEKDLSIIGVVKDFHFKKLDTKIEPLVFRLMPKYNDLLFVRLSSNNISNTVSFIETKIKELDPSRPFSYYFLDEQFDKLYKSEQRMGKLFTSFSILAIIISCLGLFGLASYMAERRTKEIGVRKVLGASIANITLLLSKDFTMLVLLANIIAWPAAYYFMNNWLQDFAYRIDINIWMFILSGFLAFLIAIVTVSYQAIKAALANPVKSLKYE